MGSTGVYGSAICGRFSGSSLDLLNQPPVHRSPQRQSPGKAVGKGSSSGETAGKGSGSGERLQQWGDSRERLLQYRDSRERLWQ
ncbi:hypothetical protein UY3_08464 [Chelonia mydas]|uniref:Uncharacterized protein n=1 Tax=Chelonia mydas TaxID=8469 RepID=M7BFL6_CHEMY|nr:hypothetical protein UY3_08464 [Chelonia mydas]